MRQEIIGFGDAVASSAFSALTLLVGWQKGHPACKNWMVGWSVLPFWYLLTRVVPDKGPLNGMCVWHHLDHMQTICTSLHIHNHTNTSSLNFYRPDALPDAQPTVSKHWRQYSRISNNTDSVKTKRYCSPNSVPWKHTNQDMSHTLIWRRRSWLRRQAA